MFGEFVMLLLVWLPGRGHLISLTLPSQIWVVKWPSRH